MEKAIEIKRRAQRCIQNGDLDGALAEYEKLVQSEDSDPYNFVLLADLLFKRGDNDSAVQRYLSAVSAYEKAALFKNAIAVCKKMMRLSLAPSKVLERLASLHVSDGLGTEAALYYMQYAETLVRADQPVQAAEALRKAFDASPEEVTALERMAEAYSVADDKPKAAEAMAEAAYAYARLGRLDAAARCRQRAEQLQPGSFTALQAKRGPIAGLDELGGGSTWSDAAGAPAAAPAVDEPAPHASESEPVGEPVAGAGTAVADDADAMEFTSPDEPLETEHAPAGPPRLPSLVEAAREDVKTADPGANGASAEATAHDDDFERFPTSIGGGRPGMRFDTPAASDAGETGETTAHAEPAETEEAAAAPAPAPASPVAQPEPEPEPVAVAEAADVPAPVDEPAPAPAAAAEEPKPTVADIERLLSRAQEHFRSGDREAAGALLVDAAVAYERIGRLDNAGSIFRSLAKGPQSSTRLLTLWLDNATRRGDRTESAEVACELGDRAVNDNDIDTARGWFERACAFDPDNQVARRRLTRLAELGDGAAAVAAAPGASAPAPATDAEAEAEAESGKVEMALGRAEAVTFDLGSLLAEFQRGIEQQLSGDAQSHYDLAMTYREMGLHEQAVDSFRLAAQDSAFTYRAAEMIGRCLLEQGRFADAAHELDEALRTPQLPADAALGLRYQLGLAHEAAGDARAALAEFERVFAAQANYSDVALKLRALRQSLGSA